MLDLVQSETAATACFVGHCGLARLDFPHYPKVRGVSDARVLHGPC